MLKPVIKWSGSKRSQSERIKSLMPTDYGAYFEPFVGGGSMLYAVQPSRAVCGDICEPLIGLWNLIKSSPLVLADSYRTRWENLQSEGHVFYYRVRDRFNESHDPEDLLFLSRTCVNGLIRFNSRGDFNNSLHHTRKGIKPEQLKKIIEDWSGRIQSVTFRACSYVEMVDEMRKGDVAYLDPPYFHTKGRYYGTIDFQEFTGFLKLLNQKGVKYLLSYDGRRGEKDYEVKLPESLYRRKVLIPSGNSSFGKVINGKVEQVEESLYLNF